MLEAFFRRVLPDGGGYSLMAIFPGRPGAPHVNVRSIGDLVNAVGRLSQRPANIYYAVGTYNGQRADATAVAKRTLFLDLDSKDFGSKQQALKELAVFLKTVGFPTPGIVVDSGRGIHCYWPLDRDLPVAEWKVLSELLKRRCADVGFKADPAVTADTARVLRVPGTMNYKDATPLPCRILKDSGATFDPAFLAQRLTPAQPAAASVLSGTVGDDLSLPANAVSLPQVPYYAVEIASRCGVMKEALDTGGRDHSEPLWSNLLSLLTFCEDGQVTMPLVSQGHPGYDAAKCAEKFEYKLKRKADGVLKPVLCDTFALHKGSICNECPHRGRIKTPLVLGKQEAVSFLPFGYVMKAGGIYKVKKGATPDEPDTTIRVFPYTISEVDLLRSGTGLTAKITFSGKISIHRTELPLILFGRQSSELIETLIQAGVIISTPQLNELKIIMTNWLQRLQEIKETTRASTTTQGWGERGKGVVFAAGDVIYHADGKVEKFSHSETQQLHNYEPSGRRSDWDEAAALVMDGRDAITAAVLSAFASPLLIFTAAPGIAFSLSSAASGTGKTTALRLAQAVWAHPVRSMSMLNDTKNSVLNKMGFINNLPAYWDEVRVLRNFDDFVEMIYHISLGKERGRLDSNSKQREAGTWRTMAVLATNERIVDHMDRVIKETNSGRARVFEVQVPGIPDGTNNEVQRRIAKLDKSYGHVGQQYAKFLATHQPAVEKLLHTMTDKVSKDLDAVPDERYWVAFVAAELAAAHLVNKLGILKVDIPKFQSWLYAEYLQQRRGMLRNVPTLHDGSLAAVFRFVDAHRENILVTEYAGGPKGYGSILVQPMNGKPVKILKAELDKKVRFTEKDFRGWLHQQGQMPTGVFAELEKTGGMKRKKASISAGLANTSSARYACIEIDLAFPAFVSLLDQ